MVQAENERMHLLTFLALKQPGPLFRGMVLLGQVGDLCQQKLLASLLTSGSGKQQTRAGRKLDGVCT